MQPLHHCLILSTAGRRVRIILERFMGTAEGGQGNAGSGTSGGGSLLPGNILGTGGSGAADASATDDGVSFRDRSLVDVVAASFATDDDPWDDEEDFDDDDDDDNDGSGGDDRAGSEAKGGERGRSGGTGKRAGDSGSGSGTGSSGGPGEGELQERWRDLVLRLTRPTWRLRYIVYVGTNGLLFLLTGLGGAYDELGLQRVLSVMLAALRETVGKLELGHLTKNFGKVCLLVDQMFEGGEVLSTDVPNLLASAKLKKPVL